MKRAIAMLLGGIIFLWAQATTRAATFDPKLVAADAKWVIHLDMDATQKGKSWELLMGRLKLAHEAGQAADVQAKMDDLSTLLSVRIPDDIHGITLFGTAFGEEPAAVLVNATMDPAKIIEVLQRNAAYKKIDYGDHTIHSWFDKEKNKTVFGAFSGTSLAILSDSVEHVRMALDVIDGKAKCLAPDATLAQGQGSSVLLYLAGDGLADMPKGKRPESPIFGQLNSAWITISEEDQKLVMRASLSARTADAAEQIKAMAEGFKSMIMLAGSGEQPDPKPRLLSGIMQSLAFKTDGKTLNAEWPVTLEKVRAFLDAAVASKPHAVTDGNK